MSHSELSPRFGIVIPVHRHSVLVSEAISSVLNQSQDIPSITVVVNDGCPFEETARVVRSMAHAYPDKIINLHTPNGGLSAARNRGIQWLLERFPSIEGFFLLDADNRLEPGSIELFDQLIGNHPDADWFYPQFDMFGLVHNATHGGDWSLLMHTFDNICEAGSLVRRRVIEHGVRYDETMRLGYEDWEFWLAAARQGFRGQPVGAPFFQYRKRPESMLSGSHRVDGEIRSYMRRKHAWLFNPRTITALEHAEVPRMRVLFCDSGRILSLTDPFKPAREMTREEFVRDVWRWMVSPVEAAAGSFWVFTSEHAWSALAKARILRFALWDLERRLIHKSLSAVVLASGLNEEGCSIEELPKDSLEHIQPDMIGMATHLIRQVLIDNHTKWFESLVRDLSPKTCDFRVIQSADFEGEASEPNPAVLRNFLNVILALHKSCYRQATQTNWEWRTVYCERREKAYKIAQNAADTGTLYPCVSKPTSPRSICFLLPIAQFGGAETVALNLAAAMRRHGWRTALCIVGTNPVRLANGVDTGFDELMWFPEPSLLDWAGADVLYHGTHLARTAEGANARDMLGLLGGFDCVMGCHPAGAISILGPLRKLGVVTALHEHVVETNQWGRHLGPPMLALAHEAAVDVVATCSNQLADWLNASGVPKAKLVPVPNAAGYQISREQQVACLKARRSLPKERPLRALFLGRLDWQKGLDRLTQVIRQLRSTGANIEWRVVGKAIVEDQHAPCTGLEDLIEVESPVYTPAEKNSLYAWADVVLLPSRYEGLPLTVFEAQQLGAVPIMTKVGAFEEAIEHGINGILVDETNCIAEMKQALMRLAADRNMLRRLSDAAASRQRSWDASAAPLISRLEDQICRARKRLTHHLYP